MGSIKKFRTVFNGRKKKTLLLIVIFTAFIYFWTLPNFDQTGTIKIWDRNKILLFEQANNIGKKTPIIFNELPKNLINAAVASEDESFWSNPGVDFKAIARSLYLNLEKGRIISGASTITQQLARAAIISPNQLQQRSLIRKIREMLIAIRLNISYSKKEIITKYFNQMYFGNLAYGIQSASKTYFDKDASQLSLAEGTLLVGLISSPDTRNPFINFNAAKIKQEQILDLMIKDRYISKQQAIDAKKEKLTLVKENSNIKAPHFVHYVLNQLNTMGIKNSEGINVYTTLDYPTFVLSENIARLWVDKLKDQHDLANAALVLIDNNSGEIVDMLGGIDYFDSKNAGQINMTTALRQPGSSIKPITYATAFMNGFTPATQIYDVKKVYKTRKGEGFAPNNYDGRYHGLVLAREALASSLNLPAVEMLNRVGIGSFLKTARNLGITTLNQEDRYDLSLTLGGGEIKLTELTNAFATFARSGEYKEIYAIKKITFDNGKDLYEHQNLPGVQVLGTNGKQVSYLITDILSDPKARISGFGEKNPLVLSRPAAVKTGTTTDWHDNWTVGYTPDYTVGVWVGNNDNHPMRQITGVVGAAPIWNQFFEEFLKGKPKLEFTKPERIKQVEVCSISGQLPDDLCADRKTEIFIQGTEPKQITHPYRAIKIDTRNGLLANNNCSNEFVVEKVFINYPPEVYTWAVEDGQQVIPGEYSPLCYSSSITTGNSYLEITYPKEKAVFESAPLLVNNQKAIFEVNISSDIKSVGWYVDGNLIKQSNIFPFSAEWPLVVGKHTIYAVAKAETGKTVRSEDIHINVVEYRSGDN